MGKSGERTWLEDSYTVVLEHVQERGLSGIIEAKEEELCVLVGKTERGQKVEDCVGVSALGASWKCCDAHGLRGGWEYIHLQRQLASNYLLLYEGLTS